MSSTCAATPAWQDTLSAYRARRRLANGLTRDEILAAADRARRLGERHLAIGLVRDLLLSDLTSYRSEAYEPGEVMNRVLGPLGIWVEARALEYRRLLRELLPDEEASLHDDTPIKTLARRDLTSIPLDFAASETAGAVVDGLEYNAALESYIHRLRSHAADARDRELEWLTQRVRLRYKPGEDGLGRLWRAAGQLAGSPPAPGATLTPPNAALAIVRLAGARDKRVAVAALAAGLATGCECR